MISMKIPWCRILGWTRMIKFFAWREKIRYWILNRICRTIRGHSYDIDVDTGEPFCPYCNQNVDMQVDKMSVKHFIYIPKHKSDGVVISPNEDEDEDEGD